MMHYLFGSTFYPSAVLQWTLWRQYWAI